MITDRDERLARIKVALNGIYHVTDHDVQWLLDEIERLNRALSNRPVTPASDREAFEAWIAAMPYERSVKRWPDYAKLWPGDYYDIAVQTAWEAWQEAKKQA